MKIWWCSILNWHFEGRNDADAVVSLPYSYLRKPCDGLLMVLLTPTSKGQHVSMYPSKTPELFVSVFGKCVCFPSVAVSTSLSLSLTHQARESTVLCCLCSYIFKNILNANYDMWSQEHTWSFKRDALISDDSCRSVGNNNVTPEHKKDQCYVFLFGKSISFSSNTVSKAHALHLLLCWDLLLPLFLFVQLNGGNISGLASSG